MSYKFLNAHVVTSMFTWVLQIFIYTSALFACMEEFSLIMFFNSFFYPNRDTLDLQKLSLSGKLELILVDHHSLPPPDNWMKSFVVEVIDHRPQDVSWYWPQQLATIEIVGSCCTLIARKILEYNPSIFTPSICNLLYGTLEKWHILDFIKLFYYYLSAYLEVLLTVYLRTMNYIIVDCSIKY